MKNSPTYDDEILLPRLLVFAYLLLTLLVGSFF